MKSDRDLLELAAKAAGYVVEPDAQIPSGGLWLSELDGDRKWSPLTNDGDALRLAVRLNLTVCCAQYDAFTQVFIGDHDSRSSKSISERSDCIEDMDHITRRAIVRAAATIGEEMK